jgi:type III pantothenate kinase
MSDWLFDLGNTRIKFAPLDTHGVGTMRFIDYDAPLERALPEAPLPDNARAWVASVASGARSDAFRAALAERFHHVREVRTERALGGLRIAYREPARLGVDRFLAMLAAHAAGGGPWLVVGVGTALTIDLLRKDGEHLGGRIAPSPTLMREALHARARQLPVQGGRAVTFADDTDDALASGCEGAAVALVERSLDLAAPRVGRVPGVLLHGGGAGALAAALPDAHWRPALVLEGLAARIALARDGV